VLHFTRAGLYSLFTSSEYIFMYKMPQKKNTFFGCSCFFFSLERRSVYICTQIELMGQNVSSTVRVEVFGREMKKKISLHFFFAFLAKTFPKQL